MGKINFSQFKSNNIFTNTVKNVDNNATYLDDIVGEIVNAYCGDLDKYIQYVKNILDDTNNPVTDSELDDIVLTLPTLLYFSSTSQEALGLREDVAKMYYKDKYNDALANANGTVQVKTAQAEMETQDEAMVHIVYQKAYNEVKNKTNIALELLQSAKKVLSRRMSENDITKTNKY